MILRKESPRYALLPDFVTALSGTVTSQRELLCVSHLELHGCEKKPKSVMEIESLIKNSHEQNS